MGWKRIGIADFLEDLSVDAIWSVGAISAAIALGAISPGPSFIVVARNAMSLSRPHGLATASGMGLGAGVFALLALLGLHALFNALPLAFLALKVLGGLYLIYLACLIIQHAATPLEIDENAAEHYYRIT